MADDDDNQPDDQSFATNQTHSFAFKFPTKLIRMTIQDANGNPMANTPYEFTVEPAPPGAGVYHASTDGNGLMELRVPKSATRATLKIGTMSWAFQVGD